MWSTEELIVAAATAPGGGGRGVVRLSGAGLEQLLARLFAPTGEGFAAGGGPPRLVAARLVAAGIGAEWGGVPVAILHWPGPGGPTGGPLAEVQLPASPPLVQAVVAAACGCGARLARGGEFSLRSFLAGRIDLVQAEAVLAVVDAVTPAELASGLDRLAGGVGRDLELLRESLLDLAADVEAAIDFADERTPDAVPVAEAAGRAAVQRRLAAATAAVDRLIHRLASRDASAGAGLPRVVLVGRPNIGKSSLFNALVGRSAAIVADESGTTRDWIAARLSGDGPGCLVVDVAGIDPAGTDRSGAAGRAGDAPPAWPVAAGATDRGETPPERPLELLAAERACEEIARADVLVVCRDACPDASWPMEAGGVPPTARPVPRIAVATRCDLVAEIDRATARPPVPGEHRTSARSGAGIDGLRRAIAEAVASLPAAGSSATLRLAAGLAAAHTAVMAARDAAAEGGPAGADEAVIAGLVREAVAALDEVTGDDFGVGIGTDLLDRIFSRHCIGK